MLQYSTIRALTVAISAVLLTATFRTTNAMPCGGMGTFTITLERPAKPINRNIPTADPYMTCSALSSPSSPGFDLSARNETALSLCSTIFTGSQLNAGCYCVGPYQPVYCPNTPSNPNLLEEKPELAFCRSSCHCLGEDDATVHRSETQKIMGDGGMIGGVAGWSNL